MRSLSGYSSALGLSFMLASSNALAQSLPDYRQEPVFTSLPQQSVLLQDKPGHDWSLPQIDMHCVLLIDVSPSVDDREYRILMKGLYSAFKSEYFKSELGNGAHAVSLIFFTGKARRMTTEFINDPDDADRFAARHFWDERKNDVAYRPALGVSTNIERGLRLAYHLFRNEADFGFQSTARKIMLIGDGLQVGFPNKYTEPTELRVDEWVRVLAQDMGVSVDGYAVGDLYGLEDYFRRNVQTPQGLQYTVTYKGYDVTQKVATGRTFPVHEYTDIEGPFLTGFSLNYM